MVMHTLLWAAQPMQVVGFPDWVRIAFGRQAAPQGGDLIHLELARLPCQLALP
jgi:hypothetical protein